MHYSFVNPPKIFARNAAGRMVQIAGTPGEIGRFENIVVPDKNEIRRLRPAVRFLGKLKSDPYHDGATSNDRQRSETVRPPVRSIPAKR